MKCFITAILTGLLLLSESGFAQGDLLVTPNRLIFSGNKFKEELNLVNLGNDTTTFSISLKNFRMLENGSFKPVEGNEADSSSADKYLRIFPRKVTLAPHESQVVFVQCRRTSEIPEGEYRSHIYFRSEKNYKPVGMEGRSDTTLMSVQLIPVYGISIPAIVRSGNLKASALLENMKLDQTLSGNYNLSLDIIRSGDMSLFGNIKAEFLTDPGSKSTEIGVIQGVGIYTEINKRHITIPLKSIDSEHLHNGIIRVTYRSPDNVKDSFIAQKELVIQ